MIPIDSSHHLTKTWNQTPVGGVAIAPEILMGLLFYGHATGVFGASVLLCFVSLIDCRPIGQI